MGQFYLVTLWVILPRKFRRSCGQPSPAFLIYPNAVTTLLCFSVRKILLAMIIRVLRNFICQNFVVGFKLRSKFIELCSKQTLSDQRKANVINFEFKVC